MIALLPAPLSGTHATKGPIMVIAFAGTSDALVVDGEGQMAWIHVNDARIDWRYDWGAGTWVDVGPYEEIDDDEETPDDRGEEVPGDLPDADGTD